ncbi:MAG: hypothetical protein KJ077_10700 [Anaerolineae bacterium]|nr:hypothetical protein [Anaerolineae bacterium]
MAESQTDPFTLQVCLGSTGDDDYEKRMGVLKGVELDRLFGESTVPVALHQVVTFYTGEYWRKKIKRDFFLNTCRFWIAVVEPDAPYIRLEPEAGFPFWVAGHLDILAYGHSRTTALRLLHWWLEWKPEIPRGIELARHLGKMIAIRGLQEPHPIFISPYDIEIE